MTRRPIIERELELRTRSANGGQGAEHDVVGAIEYPILPWWQVELEVPVAISNPNEGASNAGFGDLELENKFLFWKSVQQRAQVASGFELTLPSGSASRGLGGGFSIEPFPSAGIALGPLDRRHAPRQHADLSDAGPQHPAAARHDVARRRPALGDGDPRVQLGGSHGTRLGV